MHKIIYLLSFLPILMACSNDDPGDVVFSADVLNVRGTRFSESNNSFEATYSNFIEALNANQALSIIAEVDHAANARAVGRVLNPTKIVFFANPNLGTPLLQKNQLVGLDLPQKLLFFENNDALVFAMYNSVAYLESRYQLQDTATLGQVSGVLETLTNTATNSDVKRAGILIAESGEGILTVESNQDFEQTYSSLENAISSDENLQIFVQLDHQSNAASVGMELRPTKLIIFGNPNLETPLMQNSQTIGLDLPLKMLVWEDQDGIVKISYNDPLYLQLRHGINGNEIQLQQIATILEDLTMAAAGN
ncbi:MAG TPA: DUF302 domain-containing protein [Gillisia sp.]|nr:DUF302 domain-containing protein [Gillisia sp.]